MEDWEEELCDEHNELLKRIFKLQRFTNSREFAHLDKTEQELLYEHLELMNKLYSVVQSRINRIGG